MYEKGKIPDSAYDELVQLMGKQEAEDFIEGRFYNYYSVAKKIFHIRLGRFIKSHTWLFIIIVLALLALFILDYYGVQFFKKD